MYKLISALIVAAFALVTTARSTSAASQPAMTTAALAADNATVENVSLVDTSASSTKDVSAEISLQGGSIQVSGSGVHVTVQARPSRSTAARST